MREIIYETVKEMLTQRGYIDINEIKEDPKVFSAIKQNGENICIIFVDNSKINMDKVKQIISYISSINMNHSIVIYSQNSEPTAPAKKIIKESEQFIELFEERELSTNITKHWSVPLHEKLDKEKTIQYKKLYGTKMPVIKEEDPISRFYLYQKGDIIKVTDKDNGIVTFYIVK